MFGCESLAAASTSRWNRLIAASSLVSAVGSSLIATIRFMCRCWALKTCPMPPAPIFAQQDVVAQDQRRLRAGKQFLGLERVELFPLDQQLGERLAVFGPAADGSEFQNVLISSADESPAAIMAFANWSAVKGTACSGGRSFYPSSRPSAVVNQGLKLRWALLAISIAGDAPLLTRHHDNSRSRNRYCHRKYSNSASYYPASTYEIRKGEHCFEEGLRSGRPGVSPASPGRRTCPGIIPLRASGSPPDGPRADQGRYFPIAHPQSIGARTDHPFC